MRRISLDTTKDVFWVTKYEPTFKLAATNIERFDFQLVNDINNNISQKKRHYEKKIMLKGLKNI
jgi:hypothetical protein